MTVARRAAAGLVVLAAGAALLITGCSPGASAKPSGTQSVSGADDATVKDMQKKLDDAESAAAEADSDATQNN
ncbi:MULTISPECIES: hypothetical protein [unclassified Streptomyces]|uniref:hypothetical protein n=1 Tax=unclassified Streptomyces TaxID=2593676 RepID=UPI002E119C25|nr:MULTISPECIES: hypothetical protein [unclassified Streptomyces]WSR24344.1 hypothetical protein OG573_38220 [Streptomyces sp. NBC_01205]